MPSAAPSLTKVSPQASPIPEAPPVTSAIFPSTWPMSSASLVLPPHPGLLPASGAREGCNLSRDDPATAIRGTATAFPRPAHDQISVSLKFPANRELFAFLTGNSAPKIRGGERRRGR